MSTYQPKLGLWEHELTGTCAHCELETSLGWSDEAADEPVSACNIDHWAAYWDSKVVPVAGRKLPRLGNISLEHLTTAIMGPDSKSPGLIHINRPKQDLIQFRLEDGTLAGCLWHQPRFTSDGRKFPGAITVWVFPAYQGQGIGSKLGCAAARRYGINLGIQSWSKKGANMASRAFRGHPLASAYRRNDGGN